MSVMFPHISTIHCQTYINKIKTLKYMQILLLDLKKIITFCD